MSQASSTIALALGLLSFTGCTLYHSKQALWPEPPSGAPPAANARFVSEEDSGLSIFGVLVLAEPDHYAVLLERLRRDHRCARLLYPQLDFYTDHWFLIAFPIARITSLCEPEPEAGAPIPALPAPAAAAPEGSAPAAPAAPTPAVPTPAAPIAPTPAVP